MGRGWGASLGRSDIHAIVIENSTVFALGHQAAAIGAGSGYLLNSTVSEIHLSGGEYELVAGFGAGDEVPGTARGLSLVGDRD